MDFPRQYAFRFRVVMIAAVMLLAACSGKTMVKSDLDIKGAPDWVNEGTATLNDRGGRLIHGVGEAPPMGDESLQIATADDRARAEVARVLSSFMDIASSDYASATNNTCYFAPKIPTGRSGARTYSKVSSILKRDVHAEHAHDPQRVATLDRTRAEAIVEDHRASLDVLAKVLLLDTLGQRWLEPTQLRIVGRDHADRPALEQA